MTLGQKLKAARKARRMTQRELGAGTLSESFISMVEHDRVRPSLATLQILSERLGEPLTHFLADSPPIGDQADVAVHRGEALLRQHRFTEALEAFSTAQGSAEASGDVNVRVRCESGLGQSLAGIRQFDLARQHLEAALAMAEAARNAELAAAVEHAIGFLEFRARRLTRARDAIESGIARLRIAGVADSETMGKLVALQGRVYLELGLPAQALECYRTAELLLARTADPSHQGLLHFNIGIACERQGAVEQARLHLQQAADLFAMHENLRLLGLTQRSLGILHLERGDMERAVPALIQSLHLAHQTGDDEGRAQSMVELARALTRRGEVEEARRLAEEAQALARRLQDPAEAARADAALAGVAHAEGKIDEAVTRLQQAAAVFDRLHLTSDYVRACRDLGFIIMATGEAAAAAKWFAEALARQTAPAALRTGE